MKSLHYKLFWRYAILTISIILIFTLLLYRIWGNTLRSNATSELLADCDTITAILDTKMEQIDDLSKRIVNSRQIQNLFLKDLYSNNAEAFYNKKAFSDALFDIIKLSFNHMELNMFDLSGRYIHVGMTSTFTRQETDFTADLPWMETVLNSYGKKVLLPTRQPELNETETPMISHCRAFAPENPTRETAILEMQIQYSYLSSLITDAIHNQKDLKEIFVCNHEGKLIYPADEQVSSQAMAYMSDVLAEKDTALQLPQTAADSDGNSVLFVYKTSPFTEWTVFVAESEKDLFYSFYQFRSLIICSCVLILILTLFITNQIATRLSTPIQQLEKTARSLSLDNLDTFELPKYKNDIRELDSLYNSFEQMKINLQNSLQETIAAHTVAVDAQMLALQSQMNPHFLYNTLATISILAEDEENDKIVHLCDDLSLLLRYISSGSDRNAELKQEIEHTKSYINIINLKYEDRIHFSMDIDNSLLAIHIPKLVIQPLVENCVKYALNVDPPWLIKISGYTLDSKWIIKVTDNGTGFSPEFLDGFSRQVQESLENNFLTNLSIHGMGLLNLYMRLYLLYKEKMVFKLENLPDGGASVTVGGPLPEIAGGQKHE